MAHVYPNSSDPDAASCDQHSGTYHHSDAHRRGYWDGYGQTGARGDTTTRTYAHHGTYTYHYAYVDAHHDGYHYAHRDGYHRGHEHSDPNAYPGQSVRSS